MDEIRQYILSVVSIAVLCGLIQLFFSGNSGITATVKIITGLVLTVTVISPLLQLDELRWDSVFDRISIDGEIAVADGEQVAKIQLSQCIKENAESYILNKANALGAYIETDVSVTEDALPIPKQVTVNGMISPYAKKQLSRCIMEELGVAEEDQIWIS